MPRVQFSTLKDAEGWIDEWINKVRGRAYIGYLESSTGPLIMVPTVSTDPIVYGIIWSIPKDDAREFAKILDIPIIPVSKFDWDSTREP